MERSIELPIKLRRYYAAHAQRQGCWFGLLAVAMATVALDYFFIAPHGSLVLDKPDLPYLLEFALPALLTCWFVRKRQTTEIALRMSRDDMESKVQERRAELARVSRIMMIGERSDNWYAGDGAYQPWTFGYTARSGGGALGLANLYSFSLEAKVNQHLTLPPYIGFAQGKSVVQAIYPRGGNGRLAFLEFNYRY